MSNQWLRLWHDMPTDPKWRTIARISKQPITSVISVYLHMLVCASNATERGRTDALCDEDVASALDMETENVSAIVKAMEGRVIENSLITGWDKRQPKKEDNSALRSKEWREKKKEERNRTTPNETDTQEEDTEEDTEEDIYNYATSASEQKSNFQKIYDAGCAVFPSLTIANTSSIHQWIAAGCSPELDAVPELQRLAKAGKSVKAWTYFTGAIMDAKATRENPPPAGIPKGNYNGNSNSTSKPNSVDKRLAALYRAGSSRRPEQYPAGGESAEIIGAGIIENGNGAIAETVSAVYRERNNGVLGEIDIALPANQHG